jgi:hypothetical protein
MNEEPASKAYLLAVCVSVVSVFLLGLVLAIKFAKADGWSTTVAFVCMPLVTGLVCGVMVRAPRANLHATSVSALIAIGAVAPLLGEGMICLIVAGPIYLVASILVGQLVAWISRSVGRLTAAALVVPLTIGASTLAPPTQPEALEDSVDVAAPPEEVFSAIERLDQTDFDVPVWARWVGLPMPQRIEGRGAAVGDVRIVSFSNGALRAEVTASAPPSRFALSLSIARTGPEFIDHWCTLQTSTFELVPLEAGRTRVIHRTTYVPRAYPRVYFRTAEQFFGHALQGTLLRSWAARFEARAPMVAAR